MGQHSMCQRISEVNSDFLQLRMFERIVMYAGETYSVPGCYVGTPSLSWPL
jgi:hypothetical protein